MTTEVLAQILDERLTRWRAILVEAHATPLLLIGICHAPGVVGSVQVCMPVDVPEEQRLKTGVLRQVLAVLQGEEDDDRARRPDLSQLRRGDRLADDAPGQAHLRRC